MPTHYDTIEDGQNKTKKKNPIVSGTPPYAVKCLTMTFSFELLKIMQIFFGHNFQRIFHACVLI